MVAALAAAAALGGCRASSAPEAGGDAPAATTRLTVFAASSLTEAFRDVAEAFERAHPGVEVETSFAGSQVLRLQLEQGAEADVFASANEGHMDALVEAGVVDASAPFAGNRLVVITPRDDPAGIATFADLGRAERLVIGADTVPVGVYTRRLLERARGTLGDGFVDAVRASVASEESNVRLVRAKVALGEADAAIVYRTDARASDRVRVVEVPDALAVRARYVVGPVTRAARPEGARAFVAFVRSPEGRAILERHGFEAPAP